MVKLKMGLIKRIYLFGPFRLRLGCLGIEEDCLPFHFTQKTENIKYLSVVLSRSVSLNTNKINKSKTQEI